MHNSCKRKLGMSTLCYLIVLCVLCLYYFGYVTVNDAVIVIHNEVLQLFVVHVIQTVLSLRKRLFVTAHFSQRLLSQFLPFVDPLCCDKKNKNMICNCRNISAK